MCGYLLDPPPERSPEPHQGATSLIPSGEIHAHDCYRVPDLSSVTSGPLRAHNRGMHTAVAGSERGHGGVAEDTQTAFPKRGRGRTPIAADADSAVPVWGNRPPVSHPGSSSGSSTLWRRNTPDGWTQSWKTTVFGHSVAVLQLAENRCGDIPGSCGEPRPDGLR
jgi:hypothetical protein